MPQIAILDFGSQYTHLIARRIRQLGVRADIFSPTTSLQELRGVKGIILSGGPQSVHDQTAVAYTKAILDLPVPILGLCYGHQLLAQHFGGQVKPGKVKEYSLANVTVTSHSGVMKGLAKKEPVWMSHGDQVIRLPHGFEITASTSDCPVAAMANLSSRRFGLQFHPEVTHSVHGMTILNNFVFDVCGCAKDWSTDAFWNEIVADVKKTVGSRNVFLLVSGGVDSSVCYAVLEKIFGPKRVFALHIDNGFMRKDESAQIKEMLAKAGFDDLDMIDATETFLSAVAGMVEPEQKRKTIGRVFLQVKDEVMAREKLNPKDWVLAQGTIYPDTIETGGTKHADTIKTHHNRVEEILKLMKMNALVEPLKHLYKDEVRELGQKLGLPSELLNRHPFPGPGLSIRALCSNGNEKIDQESKINAALKKRMPRGLSAAVVPLKSVGVQGDNRTYRHPALVQGSASWKQLRELSVRLTNEVHAINRVVYLLAANHKISFLGSRLLADSSLEQEKSNSSSSESRRRRDESRSITASVDVSRLTAMPAHLNHHRLNVLREADAIVTDEIRRAKLYDKIWQFPVILAPLTLHGGETIILRPIESKEAMTVRFFEMAKPVLNSITKKLSALPNIDLVLYDITNKPPGTIEWE